MELSAVLHHPLEEMRFRALRSQFSELLQGHRYRLNVCRLEGQTCLHEQRRSVARVLRQRFLELLPGLREVAREESVLGLLAEKLGRDGGGSGSTADGRHVQGERMAPSRRTPPSTPSIVSFRQACVIPRSSVGKLGYGAEHRSERGAEAVRRAAHRALSGEA